MKKRLQLRSPGNVCAGVRGNLTLDAEGRYVIKGLSEGELTLTPEAIQFIIFNESLKTQVLKIPGNVEIRFQNSNRSSTNV